MNERENLEVEYVCHSWQYFIQRTIGLINRGYLYYSIGQIPESKADKLELIDSKIIAKYKIALGDTNDRRNAKRKNKRLKNANYDYLRYKTTFIIFRTHGEESSMEDDKFLDVNLVPIKIKVGETISLFIRKRKEPGSNKNHFTVCMSDKTYYGREGLFLDLIRVKKIDALISEFNKLNNLPCYKGINEQKQKLKKFILFHCQKKGIKLNADDLKILVNRKIYKNDPINPDPHRSGS